jgi:hypothetical protein
MWAVGLEMHLTACMSRVSEHFRGQFRTPLHEQDVQERKDILSFNFDCEFEGRPNVLEVVNKLPQSCWSMWPNHESVVEFIIRFVIYRIQCYFLLWEVVSPTTNSKSMGRPFSAVLTAYSLYSRLSGGSVMCLLQTAHRSVVTMEPLIAVGSQNSTTFPKRFIVCPWRQEPGIQASVRRNISKIKPSRWLKNSAVDLQQIVLKIIVAIRTRTLASYGVRVLCCYQDLNISAVRIFPTIGIDWWTWTWSQIHVLMLRNRLLCLTYLLLW